MPETSAAKADPVPKTRRRKDARPAEIIAASMVEFRDHGFERARLDRIAKSAGIAKGTIYLYFESKEVLFEEAVRTYILSSIDAADENMKGFDGPTSELIERLLRIFYEKLAAGHAQTVMRILVSEGDRFPDLSKRYHDIVIKRGLTVLTAIIQRGIDRGDVKEGPMTETPELLIAPSMFFVVHQMVFSQHHPLDLDDFFRGHVDMLMRALKG